MCGPGSMNSVYYLGSCLFIGGVKNCTQAANVGLHLNGLVIACYMCGSLRTFMTFSCEISGMVASSPYFMFIFQITMNVEIKKTTKNMCDNFQIPLLQ